MALIRKSQPISLIIQGQRGTLTFFDAESWVTRVEPSRLPPRLRVPDPAVANDVDHRGLPDGECASERGTEMLRPLDMLAMAVHRLEHSVVALAGQHVEGIGPAFQERHFIETWTPRAVVPDDHDDRKAVAASRFDVKPAYTDAAVSDDQDHLLSGTGELRPDRHAHAMTDRSEQAGVENLSRKARAEDLRGASRSS